MIMTRLFTAAAAVALMSGAALAQSAPAAPAGSSRPASETPPLTISDAVNPPPATAPSAASSATDVSGVVPMSSQSPEVQATLKAGDANVITNGPVADTPENRAKYGKPDSNAGRKTAPQGN